MAPTVHLHIGEPKSGTTYLQSILSTNEARLRDAGWLYPRMADQIRAAQDAIRDRAGGDIWAEFAATLLDWSGSASLVSMETLCRARRPAVKRALDALDGATLRVHITVRDLLRSLPAQWQQTTQHRKTWSWREYCTAVLDESAEHPAARNFWSQHNLAETLDIWGEFVGPENIYVITVPPADSDPTLLWQRFSSALGLGSMTVTFAEPANESLGAVSAELLRRINLLLTDSTLNERQYNLAVRQTLARGVLAPRRSEEPRVPVPHAANDWARSRSDSMIAAVQASGATVIGDLNDLRPQALEYHELDDPDDATLLEAALATITGLLEVVAKR